MSDSGASGAAAGRVRAWARAASSPRRSESFTSAAAESRADAALLVSEPKPSTEPAPARDGVKLRAWGGEACGGARRGDDIARAPAREVGGDCDGDDAGRATKLAARLFGRRCAAAEGVHSSGGPIMRSTRRAACWRGVRDDMEVED